MHTLVGLFPAQTYWEPVIAAIIRVLEMSSGLQRRRLSLSGLHHRSHSNLRAKTRVEQGMHDDFQEQHLPVQTSVAENIVGDLMYG